MKGRIKLANVSIKYEKVRKKKKEIIITKPIEAIIVVNEEKRLLKFQKRVISRICDDLNINKKNLINIKINSVEIIKDIGQTNYNI